MEPELSLEGRTRSVGIGQWVVPLSVGTYLALAVAGLSIDGAIGTSSIVSGWVLFAFLWGALIGWLILRRHPAHPIGWIFCVGALLYGLTFFVQRYAVYSASRAEPLPLAGVASSLAFWLLLPVIGLLGFYLPLLFPDGELPSARWRPVAWLAAGLTAAGTVYSMLVPASLALEGYPTIRNPTGIAPPSAALEAVALLLNGVYLAVALLCVASVFARLRASDREQTLQIKWFSYAAVLLFAAFVVGVLSEPFPDLEALDEAMSAVAITALPTTVGIAVLKYRLYDIDLLINRTVLYALLTGILAGLYTASIALFQRLFVATTGQGSDIAIVFAIFVLATMFTPIRNRLQAAVDRALKSEASRPAMAAALDDIERLALLHGRGVLTDEEFSAKKRQVLGI